MKRLTMKEQAFLKAYTDSKSDTFGNGTRSILKAGYKCKNDNVAGNRAWNTLKKAKVVKAMEKVARSFECEIQKQAEDVAEIMSSIISEIKNKQDKMPLKEIVSHLEKATKTARYLAEVAGKVGSHQTAVNIVLGDRASSNMGLFDLMKAREEIDRQIEAKQSGVLLENDPMTKRLNAPVDTFVMPKEEESAGYIHQK